MVISAQHKKFLLIDQCLIPAIFNFLINGLIAWLIFRSMHSTFLWGEGGFGGDLLITALLLPALTCLIVSPIIVGQVNKGKVLALPEIYKSQMGMANRSLLVRAIYLGLLGVIFAALPIVLLLHFILQHTDNVSLVGVDYALFKAIWAALLAMLITPVIAWWALQSV